MSSSPERRTVLTQGGNQTDSEAGEETTGQEKGNGSGNGLENNTEVENPARGDEGHATSDGISEEGGGQGTEESAGREDGDDGGFLVGRNVLVTGGVHVAGAEEALPVGLSKGG